ncbi:hypothetical protein D3C87_948510 [compost metagenome]
MPPISSPFMILSALQGASTFYVRDVALPPTPPYAIAWESPLWTPLNLICFLSDLFPLPAMSRLILM